MFHSPAAFLYICRPIRQGKTADPAEGRTGGFAVAVSLRQTGEDMGKGAYFARFSLMAACAAARRAMGTR